MKKFRIIVVTFIWIVLFCGNICAEARSTALPAGQKRIKVAVQNYPGFLQVHEDGSISGYAYEYLEKIAQYTGFQYEFVEVDIEEAVEGIKNGTIDIYPGVQYMDVRTNYMDFSAEPMGEGGTVFCTLSEDERIPFNDYRSFDGMRISVLKGSIRKEQAMEKLEEYGAAVEFIEFATDKEAKEALENGTADAAVMSSIRCEKGYKIVARLNSTKLYFGLNKAQSFLKPEIDRAMEAIHVDYPYYEAGLYDRYYGDVEEQIQFTKDEINFIKNAGPITVAISGNLKPVEYYDEKTDSFGGIVVDSYRLISEYTGLEFRFVERDREDELLDQIKTGEVQLIGCVVRDKLISERMGIRMSEPFYECSMVAVVNQNVKNYQAQDNAVAIRTGYPVLEKLSKRYGYNRITYYDTMEECIEVVNRGKADMTIIPVYCRERLVEHSYYKNISSFILPDSEYEYSIGMSPDTDETLCSILDKAVRAIDQDTRNRLVISNLESDRNSETWRDILAENVPLIFGIGFAISGMLAIVMYYRFQQRKRMNEALQKVVERAEYESHAKDDFLSRMSHDMRTPMNAIIGISSLGEEETREEGIREYFQNIHNSAEFLLDLINDILDTSKIKSEGFTLHFTEYSTLEFEKKILSSIKPLCRQKHINFVYEKKDRQEEILWIDHLRFEQIVINLLTNAVKFTPEGGQIELYIENLKQEGKWITKQLVVRDNGSGMSSEFMEHMYEPFAQEHSTLVDRTEGSGLGLSIVNKLVDMMGGTITCNSEQGKGTEFVVVLDVEVRRIYDLGEDDQVYPVQKEQKNKKYHLAGKKVLLCEDHPLNTQIGIKLLEKQGMQVVCAENGQMGAEVFAESEPGSFFAILMDIRMPVMDGLTAAETIRKMKRSDAVAIPIIAMTANAFDTDREKSKAAGMNDHLAKPIEPQDLYDTLEKYVGN